jgi:hypothetical protein
VSESLRPPFAGNFFECGIHAGLRRYFFRGFVEFERELPAQNVHGGLLWRVGAFAGRFPHLGSDGVYVRASHGRVHCANVHHAPAFRAVQPDVSTDRSGVVELKDEFAVVGFALPLVPQFVVLSGRNRFACESVSGVEGPLPACDDLRPIEEFSP